jgi:hypothetical protein
LICLAAYLFIRLLLIYSAKFSASWYTEVLDGTQQQCRLTPQCEFAALNFKFLVLFNDYEIGAGKSHVITPLFDKGSPVTSCEKCSYQENILKITFYPFIANAGQAGAIAVYLRVGTGTPSLGAIITLCTV